MKNIPVLIIFLLISINVFAQDEYDLAQQLMVEYDLGMAGYGLGKYHIMQYRANVRKEPTRNSDVVAVLSLHDEIEILENSGIAEKINDVVSFWYKIKCGNIIGYTYGGNIAYKTFVTDIDRNGINDYFYYRHSWRGHIIINPHNDDLVIYINNQKISSTILKTVYRDDLYFSISFCRFTERDGYVAIELETWGHDHYGGVHYYFKVTPDGRIEYIGME